RSRSSQSGQMAPGCFAAKSDGISARGSSQTACATSTAATLPTTLATIEEKPTSIVVRNSRIPARTSANSWFIRALTWSNPRSTRTERSSSRSSVHACLTEFMIADPTECFVSKYAHRLNLVARVCDETATVRAASAADPGAGAGVGPDFGGDAVLFGLGGVLGFALAAVQLPGRGQDLVGAAGAARRVDGAIVAARLAHHDVGRDRVGAAEPAADFFFGFGFAGGTGFGGADPLHLG